jgi:5'-nucleotidase
MATASGLCYPQIEKLINTATVKVTILHTNDTHSRLDPFPKDGSRYSGLGGAARRATVIKRIRSEERNVFLFDAGDILQGTPYFNLYRGEPEILVMNEMGYAASAIGNHDFDAGIERLGVLSEMADFPFLCCNYDFENTPMAGLAKDRLVLDAEGVKIGVTGIGIELDALVPEKLYGGTVYQDPVLAVNEQARMLKNEEKCDYVICLSHLGYRYRHSKISDISLAPLTEHIDLIIGGHTHTFLDQPVATLNKKGEPLLITQVGWAGIVLGRIDLYFTRSGKKICETCSNTWVDKYSV